METTKQPEWQQWLKWTFVVITLLYVLQGIFAFSYAHFISKWIHDMGFSQYNSDDDDFLKEFAQSAREFDADFDAKREAFKKKFNDFNDDFDKEMKERETRNAAAIKDWKKDQAELHRKLFHIDEETNSQEDKKRLGATIKALEPFIECDKKVFGKSSFDPNNPKDYLKNRPFQELPLICKEFETKV